MRRVIHYSLLIGTILFLSCTPRANNAAILWTDRPEFAFYAEYFNTAQERYRVEVRYFDFPAQKLSDSDVYPDIVAGSWLKSASTRVFFKVLDSHFGPKGLSKDAFYPRLLAMGNIEDKQYLLPVSFNAPVIIFARDRTELSNPFTIGFGELKKLGGDYNRESSGVYTRMGFSPAWDDNFLFITAALFNTSFREANPLAWNSTALEEAMDFVYDWTTEINTGVQAEEDFRFKYFYDPPAKLVLSGRILFTCINSDALFTLGEEQRSSLDFRWISENNTIPLTEGSVYIGLVRKSKAPKAAAAFLHWFFQADTQRQILQRSRDNGILETSFGISGGFSGLRSVTEHIFPQFFPELLGHMPPQDFLSPANILPRSWTALKEHTVIPYLRERSRLSQDDSPLERRIADWLRLNS
jgi:ABC-type glycerol-3-phosphate transport system substrate-binding protein